jgi:deoxyinosine 3'endonuclease (endonuclease V)
MFDGNGILHPRGLGLASHFGVCTNTCTIGVAKNLYQMGNILRDEHHLSQINSLSTPGDHFFIENSEGNRVEVLGAVRCKFKSLLMLSIQSVFVFLFLFLLIKRL